MRLHLLGGVLLASASLSACAHKFTPPEITYDEAPKAAVLEPDPPKAAGADRGGARSLCPCPAS